MRPGSIVSMCVLSGLSAWLVFASWSNPFRWNRTLLGGTVPPVAAGGGPGPREASMDLVSSDFPAGGAIPRGFTEDGGDLSPALAWTGAPEGTQAFALIVDDPDAPSGRWVHWVCYDLPGNQSALVRGQAQGPSLAGGGKQGRNGWGRLGWNGPAPPPGKPHRYVFKLYALARPLGLDSGAGAGQVEAAMAGKVLGQGQVLGIYGR
jgi:hypothetical protein